MKKTMVCFAILVLFASSVFAAFVPPQLRFSAPEKIQYEFDGTPLKFDVTVTGTPAQSVFLVYTKDKAADIVNIQNGYLGWHLVNKVDTCVYMSDVVNLDIGPNEITWDGHENCGNKATGLGLVPAGEYTYYIWGFDNVHPKIQATSTKIPPRTQRCMNFEELTEQGLPNPAPLLHVCAGSRGPIYKWTMGLDPYDDTLIETTSCNADMPTEPAPGYRIGMYEQLLSTDWNTFFIGWKDNVAGYQGYYKFTWTPNGDSIRDQSWGGEEINMKCDPGSTVQFGIIGDDTYMYSGAGINDPIVRDDFLVIDYDGEIVETIDMSAESERRGSGEGSGVYLWSGASSSTRVELRNGLIWMKSGGCYRNVLDYYRYEESGDIDDLLVWGNGNGDYIGDLSYQTDAESPWDCNSGGPSMNQMGVWQHGFSTSIISTNGAVSFNIFGPDGIGVGDFAYAGEINGLKHACNVCDGDTPFDGIYSDNLTPLVEGEAATGVRFCPADSWGGIITNKSVDVVENAPVAFSVAQNLPNPFNPSTTINYTLPDAGIVNIDVYNVAGQKVDTIVNEYMNTGSHSVVWDASGFSAGVYFYTVKFKGFTKSMKMTLVK